MAIYSLNVGSIGRSTHAAGTAGAHVRYISRPAAASEVFAHAMPSQPNAARSWMDRAEEGDRKNARVLDRIRLAIPRELTREQRQELVRVFCEDVTGNRVPWLAAIHQDGEDTHNPHAHIVVRDRDLETGKRVLKWSDSPRDRKAAGLPENAVEHIRERWEARANEALARAGHDIRIDRRSLEAQGIDRVPTIHIGPNAAHIETTVQRPESKTVIEKRGGRERVIDYPKIDAGRTRQERHAEIVDLNLERDARSPDFATRARAQLRREEILKDRNLERQLITEARRLTIDERRAREGFRAHEQRAHEEARARRAEVDSRLKASYAEKKATLLAGQAAERSGLKADQARLSQRVLRVLDLTGGTRRRHEEARRAMVKAQAEARRTLVARTRAERAVLQAQIAADLDGRLRALATERQAVEATLAGTRTAAERMADQRRQLRAAERAQAEIRLEAQLREAERLKRSPEDGPKGPQPARQVVGQSHIPPPPEPRPQPQTPPPGGDALRAVAAKTFTPAPSPAPARPREAPPAPVQPQRVPFPSVPSRPSPAALREAPPAPPRPGRTSDPTGTAAPASSPRPTPTPAPTQSAPSLPPRPGRQPEAPRAPDNLPPRPGRGESRETPREAPRPRPRTPDDDRTPGR